MARAAELKFRATLDGAQAESAMRRLETSMNNMGTRIANNLTSKFASFLSVEMALKFAKALDKSALKLAEMVDKIREGKATVEEIERAGTSRSDLGFAAGYKETRDKMSVDFEGIGTKMLRGAIGLFGSTSIGGIALSRFSENANEMLARSLYGDLGDIDAAAAQGKLAKKLEEKGKTKAQAAKDAAKAVEETSLKRGFNKLQSIGAYANTDFSMARTAIRIESDQLVELRKISKAVSIAKFNNGSQDIFPQ